MGFIVALSFVSVKGPQCVGTAVKVSYHPHVLVSNVDMRTGKGNLRADYCSWHKVTENSVIKRRTHQELPMAYGFAVLH